MDSKTTGKGKKVPIRFFSARGEKLTRQTVIAQSRFRKTCQECGFKIRGPNHEAGTHHRLRHPSMRGK